MRPHYLLMSLLIIVEFSRNFDGALSVGIDGRSKLQKENSDIAESADHYNRFLRGQDSYQSEDADTRIKSEEWDGQGRWKKFLGRNDLTIKTLSRTVEDEAYRLKMF
ncbi:RxLR effector protein [Phytophthora megakarya]|uniref:RxLR effector protein n=1 Tax=Phytophthora megakarya TaxID=4795 RepID=A0A225VZF5_9STRA|nr:RxLR effector protein [Phytophthora megakarya]